MKQFKIEKEVRLTDEIVLEKGDKIKVIEDRTSDLYQEAVKQYITNRIKTDSNDIEWIGENLIMNISLAINDLENRGEINSDIVKRLHNGMKSI